MSELYRVVVVALLLVDVQRSVICSSDSGSRRSSGVSVVLHDDNGARPPRDETSAVRRYLFRCRPPTTNTLWLRLQYRSRHQSPPTTADDESDGIQSAVDDRVPDRPLTIDNVERRRHRARHGGRRRSREDRARRRRLKSAEAAAAANLTSAELDAIRVDGLRRRDRRFVGRALEATSSSSSGSRPAWQCGLEKFWRRTGRGVFPAYVQTGRCSTPTCMMGLYECRERRYAVSVLRRRRGRCVPVPLTGTNSTLAVEELWTPSHLRVVVACECSSRRAMGVHPHTASSPP